MVKFTLGACVIYKSDPDNMGILLVFWFKKNFIIKLLNSEFWSRGNVWVTTHSDAENLL